MSTSIQSLFVELCALETEAERRVYYLGHPILTSPAIVDELFRWVASGGSALKEATARQ